MSDLALVSNVKKSPVFSFGSKGRNLANTEALRTPGPGSYAIDQAKDGRKARPQAYSFRPKLRSEKLSDVPGPGSYDQDSKFNRPGSSRGAMSQSQRHSRVGGSFIPGPGAYDIPNSIGKSKSGFSMRPRTGAGIKSDSVPGPGTYETNDATCSKRGLHGVSKHANKAFRFAQEHRSLKYGDSSTPGPGSYDCANKSQNVKTAAPKFSMKGGGRPILRMADTPGPGSHNVGSLFGSSYGYYNK
ncbi:unnamed protein product [Amoebophrya sp. A25]|nr:unnamed protein product [Amoebophrya sp. A25]|eukprot:GSA25T00018266001.1